MYYLFVKDNMKRLMRECKIYRYTTQSSKRNNQNSKYKRQDNYMK